MEPHVSVITLGVRDLERAKQFYAEGLGWPVLQDFPVWVCLGIGGGAAGLGLQPWDALAADAGVEPDGSGFRGVTLSYLVRTEDRVAEVIAEAERAGATVVKPAERAQWGGASGYFADPEGFLWKVASGEGDDHPFAE
jgi:catechol 2,3-dioxygenase-like lactoylglutathione lyase family enzyme